MGLNQYHYYKIYGVTLASEVEYPQLLSAEKTEEPDLWLKVVSELEGDSETDYANRVYRITKDKIHFSNHKGSFCIAQGSNIEIRPKKGVPLADLTPFVFGYCMSMLFWQRGQLAIHCSAVRVGEKAILICGGSGSGKSTLTARLLEHGGKLMTDDVAIVGFSPEGQVLVYPAFPQQKLCRDAVVRNNLNTDELLYIDEDRDKFAVGRREEFCDKVTELGGIVALNRHYGESVTIQALQGHAVLNAVLNNLFMKPVFEQSHPLPPEDMMKCIKIAQTVPVYQLLRPMEGDTTKEQIRLLKEQLRL